MTTIPELSKILQQLFIEDANQIGRESGFIKRQRKLSGSTFARSLVFGWQANPNSSLEELCQSARVSGVSISPQGLQERINSPQAHEFLRQLLLKGLTYLVQAGCERTDLLENFTGVYLQDSSRIELPDSLASLWQGNMSANATLKVHAVMDYFQGSLDMTLANGRAHDSPLQTVNFPKNSLRLADLGYFNVEIFKELDKNECWWVSRLPARAGVWDGEKVISTLTWLQESPNGAVVDEIIEITAKRLKCRLLAIPVPDEVAEARRDRVREAAKTRKKSKLQPETLALCDWTILVTNLPTEKYSAEDILHLQRLRWQIELLFKLWKQDFSLDEWRSKQPDQILTEVYAKLILALIQHWFLLLGCWQVTNRSIVKATKALKKHAFHILASLPNLNSLIETLTLILPTLARCLIKKRKAHPATFQLLARSSP